MGSTTGYVHDTEVVRSANLGSKLQTTKTELVADFFFFVFKVCLRRCGRGGEGGEGARGLWPKGNILKTNESGSSSDGSTLERRIASFLSHPESLVIILPLQCARAISPRKNQC